MTNKIYKLRVLFLPLVFFISFNSLAQEDDLFKDSGRWMLTFQPVLYQKASITANNDYNSFVNKSMPSANLGFMYRYFETRSWNFQIGFLMGVQPGFNLEFMIDKEDIFLDYDLTHKEFTYSRFNYNIPVIAEYTNQLARDIFLSASLGFNFLYHAPQFAETGVVVINEDETEAREIFAISTETNNSGLYAQLFFSTGIYIKGKQRLYNMSIIYNKNLGNTFSGNYAFDNLFVSPRTEGEYKLSGNYFGLSISMYLKRHTKKQKRR